jgi:hypothetical protein
MSDIMPYGNQFYVTLLSNDSQTIYPDNTLASFTSRLAQPIDLGSSDNWEVGLQEYTHPPLQTGLVKNSYYIGVENKLIYCDLIAPQFFGGNLIRCLRSYVPSAIDAQYKFNPIQYVQVEKRYFHDISIAILTVSGKIQPFRSNENPVKIVLHFRKL